MFRVSVMDWSHQDRFVTNAGSKSSKHATNSMAYLEKSPTDRFPLEFKKEENLTVIGVTEDVEKYTNDYRIGTSLDVIDASYHWYSAKIVDIDVLHRKALQVHYDGFDDKWNSNEWIPLTKTQFRTALHKSKSQGNGKEEGGVHALIATRYGRSRVAGDLRLAFDPCSDKSLSEVHVLLEGYAFKRGNFVKNWK
eukprot:321556_1